MLVSLVDWTLINSNLAGNAFLPQGSGALQVIVDGIFIRGRGVSGLRTLVLSGARHPIPLYVCYWLK
jgi:hypothetical protein